MQPIHAAQGRRLRQLLVARGIKGRQFAEMMGVDESTVSKWLSGRQDPTHTNVLRMAEILESTPEFIRAEQADRSTTVRDGRSEYFIVRRGEEAPTQSSESPAEQLLTLLKKKVGAQRLAKALIDSDLISAAYKLAREDGWPVSELRKIDDLRDQILDDGPE